MTSRIQSDTLTEARGNVFMSERWLSVNEIAEHLGVNPDTIYKWIIRKKMPAHKLGRLWKFMATEVDEWVRAGKAAGDDRND
jgi:excisionase family DNA binding protein